MSDIKFTCPHCSFSKQLPASVEGQQGNCPSCKAVVTISADAPVNPSALPQQPSPQQPLYWRPRRDSDRPTGAPPVASGTQSTQAKHEERKKEGGGRSHRTLTIGIASATFVVGLIICAVLWMDGFAFLIIFLVGLACVVACLVWHAKVGFDNQLVGDLLELVQELVGGLFGWVWGLVVEMEKGVGVLVSILIFIGFGFSCYGYWAVGDFFYGDETWERYCPFMCVIALVGGVSSACVMTATGMDDDDVITIFMFGPILVSFLVFLIFGALHIVNLLAA